MASRMRRTATQPPPHRGSSHPALCHLAALRVQMQRSSPAHPVSSCMGVQASSPPHPALGSRSSPGRSQGRRQQGPVPRAAVTATPLPVGAGSAALWGPSTPRREWPAVPRALHSPAKGCAPGAASRALGTLVLKLGSAIVFSLGCAHFSLIRFR